MGPETTEKAKQILQKVCPEIATDGEAVAVFVDLASGRCSHAYFGKLWDQAVAYLAAHMWTVSNRGGDAGAGGITSKREGDLSIGYASGNNDSLFGSTSYGLFYLSLLRQCGAGVTITSGGCPCRRY